MSHNFLHTGRRAYLLRLSTRCQQQERSQRMLQYHSPEIKVRGICRVSVHIRVGIIFFQMCAWRQPAGRAAPVPALPDQRLSCSGAAGPAPDGPGLSQIPGPLLETNTQWDRNQRRNRKRYHGSFQEGNYIPGLVTSSTQLSRQYYFIVQTQKGNDREQYISMAL